MHPDCIWNDLELQTILENNISKACILTVFKMIYYCSENKDGKWCILTVFETN